MARHSARSWRDGACQCQWDCRVVGMGGMGQGGGQNSHQQCYWYLSCPPSCPLFPDPGPLRFVPAKWCRAKYCRLGAYLGEREEIITYPKTFQHDTQLQDMTRALLAWRHHCKGICVGLGFPSDALFWASHFNKDINKLWQIQRRAAKKGRCQET